MQTPKAKLGFLGALISCAFILATTARAKADPPQREAAREPATSYTFQDDEVFGSTSGPMGEVLQVRRRPERESLIRVRDAFVRELLKSIEAL